MPLSTAQARQFLTRRDISCEAYVRDDGLIDIEGHLTDRRAFDITNAWRGTVKAGDPVHDMWVRITLDDGLIIRAIESSTDSAPYPPCREIAPTMQRLVGLKVTGGFKQEMRKRIGHTEGCTHIVTLVETLSGVAIQATAARRRDQGKEAMLGTFGTRDPSRPPLIGTCRSYAATSPIVAKMWPQFYKDPAPVASAGHEDVSEKNT